MRKRLWLLTGALLLVLMLGGSVFAYNEAPMPERAGWSSATS